MRRGAEGHTHLEDVVPVDKTVARVGRLQIVDGLPHVTLGREQNGLHSVVAAVDLACADS